MNGEEEEGEGGEENRDDVKWEKEVAGERGGAGVLFERSTSDSGVSGEREEEKAMMGSCVTLFKYPPSLSGVLA